MSQAAPGGQTILRSKRIHDPIEAKALPIADL
jgi:hypothetical protein